MAIVKLINAVASAIFGVLFAPFSGLNPVWPILIVSILFGVVAILVFGRISNQDKIKDIKDRIRGNIIAIRIYQDDIGLLFKLQWRILVGTLNYLRYSLPVFLFVIPPLIVIAAQMFLHFEHRPFQPGETTLVDVELQQGTDLSTVSLEVPAGVTIETPAVRIPSRSAVSWRVRVDEPGEHMLAVKAGGDQVDKQLVAGGSWASINVKRCQTCVSDTFLFNPGEPPIEAGNRIQMVEVKHPSFSNEWMGIDWHWLILFLVFSLVAGFGLKGVLGVEI
ncbi:hypothetical protein ABI59_09775 [Acidobacteria bacterium Mor1]|nr:hypothetical protein ABI59_09775 [Acidobacteria bacterium Mor1]